MTHWSCTEMFRNQPPRCLKSHTLQNNMRKSASYLNHSAHGVLACPLAKGIHCSKGVLRAPHHVPFGELKKSFLFPDEILFSTTVLLMLNDLLMGIAELEKKNPGLQQNETTNHLQVSLLRSSEDHLRIIKIQKKRSQAPLNKHRFVYPDELAPCSSNFNIQELLPFIHEGTWEWSKSCIDPYSALFN